MLGADELDSETFLGILRNVCSTLEYLILECVSLDLVRQLNNIEFAQLEALNVREIIHNNMEEPAG